MQEMVRESHDKFMAAPKVGFAGDCMAKPERYLGTIRRPLSAIRAPTTCRVDATDGRRGKGGPVPGKDALHRAVLCRGPRISRGGTRGAMLEMKIGNVWQNPGNDGLSAELEQYADNRDGVQL